MARKIYIRKHTADTDRTKETIEDLARFQDNVRQSINNDRTQLRKLTRLSEPKDGELLYEEGGISVVTGGEYKKVMLEGPASEIPQWFIDHLKLKEALFKELGIPESEWKYYNV